MTKVTVYPGPCRFEAHITAVAEKKKSCKVTVETGCKHINGMMEALGDTFSPMSLVFNKPGQGPFYEYAKEGNHFPVHAGCPVINGILKCVEAESGLALKTDVYIRFDPE